MVSLDIIKVWNYPIEPKIVRILSAFYSSGLLRPGVLRILFVEFPNLPIIYMYYLLSPQIFDYTRHGDGWTFKLLPKITYTPVMARLQKVLSFPKIQCNGKYLADLYWIIGKI